MDHTQFYNNMVPPATKSQTQPTQVCPWEHTTHQTYLQSTRMMTNHFSPYIPFANEDAHERIRSPDPLPRRHRWTRRGGWSIPRCFIQWNSLQSAHFTWTTSTTVHTLTNTLNARTLYTYNEIWTSDQQPIQVSARTSSIKGPRSATIKSVDYQPASWTCLCVLWTIANRCEPDCSRSLDRAPWQSYAKSPSLIKSSNKCNLNSTFFSN